MKWGDVPLRSDWSGAACSIARAIDAIGDPWTLVLIRELLSGRTRFDALRDKLGIAENILSARLKSMTEAGLVTRQPYMDGQRSRFEYIPSHAAHDTLPILHAFSLWGANHTGPSDDRHRLVIICRTCGARSETGERCSACGTDLTTENVSWIRPADDSRTAVPLMGRAS